MASADYALRSRQPGGKLAHYLRVLRVIAGIEFKMKYADSALGYAWSLAKPLSYFGVLWLVFGHLLKTGIQTKSFALYLLIGIVLYTFFVDAVGVILSSIVGRGTMIRRLAFPALLIPLSVSVTACITFCINLVAVILFIAIAHLAPQPKWLLVLPLLAEFYIFILGVGLILATLFVRFRDIIQIWELTAQLLLFSSGIMYPIGILPTWAQKIVFVNPLVQVMQDARHAVLGVTGPYDPSTGWVLMGYGGRFLPMGVAVGVFLFGLWLFHRDAPYFAERV